jgi:hypothetical protein
MPTKTEILRIVSGVTLKKVTLTGDAGPIRVAYSISSKRTHEVWTAGNIVDANTLFEDELGRCSKRPS